MQDAGYQGASNTKDGANSLASLTEAFSSLQSHRTQQDMALKSLLQEVSSLHQIVSTNQASNIQQQPHFQVPVNIQFSPAPPLQQYIPLPPPPMYQIPPAPQPQINLMPTMPPPLLNWHPHNNSPQQQQQYNNYGGGRNCVALAVDEDAMDATNLAELETIHPILSSDITIGGIAILVDLTHRMKVIPALTRPPDVLRTSLGIRRLWTCIVPSISSNSAMHLMPAITSDSYPLRRWLMAIPSINVILDW